MPRICLISYFVTKTTMHAISSSSSRAAHRAAAKVARPVLNQVLHDVLANAVSVPLGSKGESHSRLLDLRTVVTDQVREGHKVIVKQPFCVPQVTRGGSHICARHVPHSMRGMLQAVLLSPN
jgi:hypothetical protein